MPPLKGPEQGFAGLDPEFFVKAADALLHGLAQARVPRLLLVKEFPDEELLPELYEAEDRCPAQAIEILRQDLTK